MGLFGGSNRRYRRYRTQMFGELEGYRKAVGKQYEDVMPTAMREQARTLEAVRGGFDEAQRYTKEAFRGAEQRAFDAQERGEADILASMQRRGLGGSTSGAQVRRGLRSDTQRTLMDISDLMSQRQSQLAMGKGMAEGSILGKLLGTTLKQQRNAGLNRVREQKLAFLSGLMSGGPPSATQEMAQFGFDLAGTAIAGVDAFVPG